MFEILFPFNGAVLNHRHGVQTANGLTIEVRGIAPIHSKITVNGVAARRDGEMFTAQITLTEHDNIIRAQAVNFAGETEHKIRVLWDKNSFKRYRVGIDDNVFLLRDLAQKRPQNIFDNHYLGILKRLHDEFGTKFCCNLFFSTPEHDFDLTQMPDTWRSQFIDNSDWLKFTWHADNEFPDRPYEYATPEQVAADYDKLKTETVRFAGEETFCPPAIVHWGELHESCFPVLKARGTKVLSGYFERVGNNYIVSYQKDLQRCEYLANHDALLDVESGIVHSKIDLIVNLTPIDRIIPTLEPLVDDRDNGEIMDLLTHEQYFWPFYFNYIPDHEERMRTALRFLTEHGYKPVWMHEGFLGAPEN